MDGNEDDSLVTRRPLDTPPSTPTRLRGVARSGAQALAAQAATTEEEEQRMIAHVEALSAQDAAHAPSA